ncbi:MAG: AMP-binding protein [Solirubrobacterales bacterium]|nr:AMP-binding protein [Solirubrobacterales bacterium]
MTVAPAPPIPDQDLVTFTLARAAELGDKPALIDGPSGRVVTYAELDERTAALAGALRARGIEKGDVVCIYMPNLPEYAVIFHGVLRANATNTTANPLYTSHELAHQLTDSRARTLFTVPDFLPAARAAAEEVGLDDIIVVGESDGDEPTLADLLNAGGEAPELDIDPDTDIAALPYSSGTTGLPKGVMLSHRNLVANVLQTGATIPITEEDTTIGVLPFFHIYGMTVIMNLGLHNGATIVTMPRFDLEGFLGLIEDRAVTVVYIVPPIALALAKHPAVEGRDLSSLRMVMSGAAPLGEELARAVAGRIGTPTIQGYGMTELSPVSHVAPVDSQKGGSIGPPLAGTECRIVDPETGEETDRGELWVRGPQVMKGYLNNDEATRETIDADGWLHTGDVAEMDDEGYYAIVDRLKELIKYKGFQVPPAELEAILINHPGVADCAVIGVPDEEAGEIPKGFVVVADGDDVTDDELMAFVAEKVSPQKKLRLIERIDAIPKSASGKILRRELAGR